LGQNGKRSGSGSRTWPDANVAPPVHRVDLTHPVVDAEHGKAVSVHPALAVPRQADRKAGPGETAWRGSNKPRPVCNGPDMPTSIRSFVVRELMEPFLLRKANDDRRLSIGASQARHKDCRASRPLISMAKAGIRHEALFATGLPNRDIPHRARSIERLEPCEGKLSRTVLRGA
jgi:hypothetical protein